MNAPTRKQLQEAFKSFPEVMLSFGVFLLIFFACIVGTIDQSKDSCTTCNNDLNKTGRAFGIFGILVSLSIIVYSSYILRHSN